jgi:hypothetical protein
MAIGGAVGVVILAQVLLSRSEDLHPGLLLGEILLYAFVVRFAALYTAPGYVGIDVWSHTRFVERILRQDTLAAIDGIKYYAAPLFHLLSVAAVRLLGLSVRNGLYLTLGVAMPLAALFVYGTARLLVPTRWALTAAALYAMGDQVVRWGIHLIPTSMGLLFFLACLYGLVRLQHASQGTREFALVVSFSVAVVLTHQISSFIVLVVLVAALLARPIVSVGPFETRSDPLAFGGTAGPVNLAGLVVFHVGLTTFTWSLTPYKGETFLETVVSYLYVNLFEAGFLRGVGGGTAAAAASSGGPLGPGSPLLAEVATYLSTGGFLLLIFAGVVGCLVALDRTAASQTTLTFLVAIVAMLFVVLGLPLFGIENFVPGRWIAYLYALLAVVGAVGLRYLVPRLPVPVVVAVLLVFVLVYPNVMIMSNDGAMDSPVFPSQHERLSYTERELAAVETVGEVTPPAATDGPLHTDHPYGTVFERTRAHPAEILPHRGGDPVTRETTVYREYQSDGGSYFVDPETGAGTILNVPKESVCPPMSNYVYANGDVTVCTVPTA